jgi:hypothetical protein
MAIIFAPERQQQNSCGGLPAPEESLQKNGACVARDRRIAANGGLDAITIGMLTGEA